MPRAVLDTNVDYLEALAREGSREAFERILAGVPDVEPDPWDRWTSPVPTPPAK